jgi:hypothetical protein
MHGQVRAKTPDGREVVGWYVSAQGLYYIVPGGGRPAKFEYAEWWLKAIRIDRATAAVDTGKLDKHDEPIRGSVPEMGFEGGDRVRVLQENVEAEIAWSQVHLSWVLKDCNQLGLFGPDELEIITDEEGK